MKTVTCAMCGKQVDKTLAYRQGGTWSCLGCLWDDNHPGDTSLDLGAGGIGWEHDHDPEHEADDLDLWFAGHTIPRYDYLPMSEHQTIQEGETWYYWPAHLYTYADVPF